MSGKGKNDVTNKLKQWDIFQKVSNSICDSNLRNSEVV